MNETPWTPGSAATAAATPISYVPGSTGLPGQLAPDDAYPGPVVLLLNASEDSRWAASTAVDIAAAWAGAGRRVVLGDLHIEDPVLHEMLGEENTDGIVDIFLYGASVARSARPPAGHQFYLIPSGTYTARPEDVYLHPRWNKLTAGFRDAHATLLLFAPLGVPGVEALAEHVGSAVVLGRGRDEERLPLGEAPLLAVLVPPGESTAPIELVRIEEGHELGNGVVEPAPPAGSVEYLDEGELEAPLVASGTDDLGTFEREPEQEVEPESEPEPAADAELEPEPARFVEAAAAPTAAATLPVRADVGVAPPRRKRHSGPGPLIWILVGAGLLVGMIAAAAVIRPELFRGLIGAPGPAATDTVTDLLPEPLPTAPPRAVGDTLPYVVQVRAFRTLTAARSEVEELRQRLPGEPFYIVPELTQGVFYYKVMAGILADTASAIALRSRLVEAGFISPADARTDGPRTWSLIQLRPLSFQLEEFASLEEARATSDSLIERGVPTYPASVPYSDGSERWRLYGGAYPDTVHADEMRQMLAEAELPGRLVVRVSRNPITDP